MTDVATTPLAAYFVEAGRRAHVVWRLDGSYSGLRDASREIVNPPGGGSEGFWVEPLRVADGLEFNVGTSFASARPIERYATSYRRADGASEIAYLLPSLPSVALRKRVWVPLREPAVVVDLEIEQQGTRPLRLVIQALTYFRLSVGWPLGLTERPRLSAVAGASAIRASNRYGAAAVVCHGQELQGVWETDPEPEPGAIAPTDFPVWSAWSGRLELEPNRPLRLRFVIAAVPSEAARPGFGQPNEHAIGGTANGRSHSAADPLEIARGVAERGDELAAAKRAHLEAACSTAPRLSSPEPELDRAFALARPALEDFKHDEPKIGLGYFAGYPAYNFYFAGDALMTLYGAIGLGDWADSRETIRTIVRGQRQRDQADQLRGELWHELSTTGQAISPNFVTLELPSILRHYLRWTGDLELVRECYAAAVLAAEWADRKDLDGDGLPDNGPEQTFADGVREDLNVAGAHLTPALWQLRAQHDLAALARALGRSAEARRWRARAQRTAHTIEATFWNPNDGSFVEVIRPDGTPDLGPGFLPWIELDDPLPQELIWDSVRAELVAELALGPEHAELAGPFAERRQARAYYAVERGDRARRLFQAGWVEPAARALLEVARLPVRWPQAGFFPETASLESGAADPRGCFHQAWTAGFALAHPVLAGLWGLAPEAARHSLTLAPAAPAAWSNLALDGLRVGQHRLALHWWRTDGRQVLVCRQERPPLTLVWRARLPLGWRSLTFTPDGCSVLRRRPAGAADAEGDRLELAVRVNSGRKATLDLSWTTGDGAPLDRSWTADAGESPESVYTKAADAEPPHRPATLPRRSRRGPPAGPSLVPYLGFLAPPFASDAGASVYHLPANYVVRYPDRLLELLPRAVALVLTDQQDAVLTEPLTTAIRAYVERGGRLLQLCYWSAAWGRGFHHTYCSLARTDLPALLPLDFEDGLRTTRAPRLEGPGRELWAELPWDQAPPLDYNPAALRPGARCWARTEAGAPLVGEWQVDAGRVLALGFDTFGFGHGTLVHWSGQRPLLRRALDWLIQQPAGAG